MMCVFLFFSTVCSLIEKLSLSKMPFKNDPVISKLIIFKCYYQGFHFTKCHISHLMSWHCVSADWQWLIDDTIKSLHLHSTGAKDGIMVSSVFPQYHVQRRTQISLSSHRLTKFRLHHSVRFSLNFVLCLKVSTILALSALCEEYYQAQAGQADSQMQGRRKMVSVEQVILFAIIKE